MTSYITIIILFKFFFYYKSRLIVIRVFTVDCSLFCYRKNNTNFNIIVMYISITHSIHLYVQNVKTSFVGKWQHTKKVTMRRDVTK